MRGNSLFNGLSNIYQEDVKRRTYGDPASLPEVYRASLEASPVAVLKTYVTQWSRPFLLGVPGNLFKALCLFSIVGLVFRALIGQNSFKRDAMLLAVMFLAPASWFVLAKAHSFIHTHINYVLWYLGFVPALLYVSFNCASAIWIAAIDVCRKIRS